MYRSASHHRAPTTPTTHSFFFPASPHHRPLHSFPTRRSSDLDPAQDHRRLAVGRVPDPRLLRVGRVPQVAGRPQAELVELDRKSTRLNSSHVRISYAVFCLKKKKKHTAHVHCLTN